jgi:hypothetical protein
MSVFKEYVDTDFCRLDPEAVPTTSAPDDGIE